MNQCEDCRTFKKADNCIRCAREAKAKNSELIERHDTIEKEIRREAHIWRGKHRRLLRDLKKILLTISDYRLKTAIEKRLESEVMGGKLKWIIN